MTYGGFVKERKTLKYKCPAMAYGYSFRGKEKCPARSGIGIPLSVDRKNEYESRSDIYYHALSCCRLDQGR